MKRHVYLDERTIEKAKASIKAGDLVISLGSFFDLVLNHYIKTNPLKDTIRPRKSTSTTGGLTSFEALVTNANDPNYVPSNESEAQAIASIRKNSAEANKPKPQDPYVPRDTEVIDTPVDTHSALDDVFGEAKLPLTEQDKENIRDWGGDA